MCTPLCCGVAPWHVDWKFKRFWASTGGPDELLLKNRYRTHNAAVHHLVEKNSLLVLDSLSDGWTVLCDFVGKEVPDEPWPHENKDMVMIRKIRSDNTKSMSWRVVVPVSFLVGLYYLNKKN